jgi:arsenite oxidase small subunit
MKPGEDIVDQGRRAFFGRATAAAVAGAAGTVRAPAAMASPGLARVSYQSVRLANLRDLQVDKPIAIAYPDGDSPGLLVKLGSPVEGGVGSDGDIVAFSTMCPHKGFPLFYRADDKTLSCPGHYSRFDCEKGGLQVFGHATQNLAQFRLHIDSTGDIFAASVDELIYGRLSNVLEA